MGVERFWNSPTRSNLLETAGKAYIGDFLFQQLQGSSAPRGSRRRSAQGPRTCQLSKTSLAAASVSSSLLDLSRDLGDPIINSSPSIKAFVIILGGGESTPRSLLTLTQLSHELEHRYRDRSCSTRVSICNQTTRSKGPLSPQRPIQTHINLPCLNGAHSRI